MTVTWKHVCLLFVCAALVVPAAMASGVVETFGERSPGKFDRAAYTAQQAQLAGQLAGDRVAAKVQAPLVIRVSEQELEQVLRPAQAERRVRVGLVRGTDVAVTFDDLVGHKMSPVGEPRNFGALKAKGQGFVWTGTIEAVGATGLRVFLSEVNLPKGAELYLYNDLGQAHGPYTGEGPNGTGEFWTKTIFGSTAALQLHFDRPMDAQTLKATQFVVSEVGYLTDRFVLPNYSAGAGVAPDKAFCSFNASCVENANCGSTNAAVNDARDAAGHMLYASGAFLYICSGGLLADTDTSSQIPYFLTANHCISKGSEASSLETFFQFDTPCGGACYNPNGAVPSVSGSTIKSTGRASDYTLLELNSAPPAGSAFLGWTSTAVAFSNGTNLYRISHPAGAPQAYSEHSVDTSAGTCRSWPRGDRIYSRDTYGATEGGSSGSPVVNGAGQVVGQLSGACGTNVNDSCDSNANATVDGALAAYFSSVEQFLDPSSGPGGPGGCTLGQVGDPCSGNGDCCSNKCKGKPGAKTCG